MPSETHEVSWGLRWERGRSWVALSSKASSWVLLGKKCRYLTGGEIQGGEIVGS
jgi:hypothetical protein